MTTPALKVLGLDLSITGTGWSLATVYDSGLGMAIDAGVLELARADQDARLALVIRRVEAQFRQTLQVITDTQPDLVAIEGYAFSARHATHLPTLGELAGLVKLKLDKLRIPFIIISPTMLKLSGAGFSRRKGQDGKVVGASKDDMVRASAAFTSNHRPAYNNNTADAIHLSVLGVAWALPDFRPTDQQMLERYPLAQAAADRFKPDASSTIHRREHLPLWTAARASPDAEPRQGVPPAKRTPRRPNKVAAASDAPPGLFPVPGPRRPRQVR